jgi:hypothetical protein
MFHLGINVVCHQISVGASRSAGFGWVSLSDCRSVADDFQPCPETQYAVYPTRTLVDDPSGNNFVWV